MDIIWNSTAVTADIGMTQLQRYHPWHTRNDHQVHYLQPTFQWHNNHSRRVCNEVGEQQPCRLPADKGSVPDCWKWHDKRFWLDILWAQQWPIYFLNNSAATEVGIRGEPTFGVSEILASSFLWFIDDWVEEREDSKEDQDFLEHQNPKFSVTTILVAGK